MRAFIAKTISAASIACSAACAPAPAPPVVNTVSDTFCARTTTYRATEAQKAELRKNEALWSSWVDWTLSINDQRRSAGC